MLVGLKFRGKNLKFEVRECKTVWSKFKGLMFKNGARAEGAEALLFDFKKATRQPIHSLFCPQFVAIWLNGNGKVMEIRKVMPWKLSIRPKNEFVKLIEIPLNNRYKEAIEIIEILSSKSG